MKKLIILSVLFLISVAIALGIVINEQSRKRITLPANGRPENSVEAPGGTVREQAPVSTTEGNIQLTIQNPPDNTTTGEGTVVITGKTNPGANVMINDAELIAGADGIFSRSVTLDDGENYFSIVAYTDAGDVAERQLTVTREVDGY